MPQSSHSSIVFRHLREGTPAYYVTCRTFTKFSQEDCHTIEQAFLTYQSVL